jgi:hypothetical protein
MTMAMPDSTVVANLPGGYDAYLGYVDGDFVTAPGLRAKFPAAELVLLTVTGQTVDCAGADVENGDLTAAMGASWARNFIEGASGVRPVLYASLDTMADLLLELGALNVARVSVRLLSAHYGRGPHICGPDSCGEMDIEMDGTQWTNAFSRPDGQADFDMSMLADDFFGPLTETEAMVQELGTARSGMTGPVVRTVQGLCNAREGLPVTPLVIDGVFGALTEQQVKGLQQVYKLTADGIVGPQTWPVLLGIS